MTDCIDSRGRRMTEKDCLMLNKFKKGDKVIHKGGGIEYVFKCYDTCMGGVGWIINKYGEQTYAQLSLLELTV